jgi:hypothetical protein
MMMLKHNRLHLTMGVLLVSWVALSSHAHAQYTLSEAKEIASYPLTMENVAKKCRVGVAIARLTGADPQLDKQMQSYGDVNSIEEEIRLLKTMPIFVQALQAQGMSARDYAFTSEALKAAILRNYPQGMPGKTSAASADPVTVAASAEHVQFYQAHMVEISKGFSEIGAAYTAAKATRK